MTTRTRFPVASASLAVRPLPQPPRGASLAPDVDMTRPAVVTRRRFLVSAGLGWLGLAPAALRGLRAASPATSPRAEQRRLNSCVFLFLFGGPSHIDLWDMKLDAP